MSIAEIIGLFITECIMLIGALGSFLPAIPSTPVVFLAALGHKLYFGEDGASLAVMVLLGCVTVFSLVMDYLASLVGAKKMGATWKGVTGALVGAVLGLLIGPWGILIGPFAGALAFEMLGGRDIHASSKAGLGALLGIIAGTLGKFACALAMAGLFAIHVMWRSFWSMPL